MLKNSLKMSGLVKAKQYDWKDTNLALFGTDVEKNVKKESAETEIAWKGAGQKVGLQIWRIVKFTVTHWPKEEYGKFYNGDSYIILNTYKDKESDELHYDVHFWIGRHSTQDEYGTAAYKTVELDTLLDDKPIQHREVEEHESSLFRSYFKKFELMEGGAETGFRTVQPEKYEPHLFHVSGSRKNVNVKQIPLCKQSLKQQDVYVIDLGLEVYQWNGVNSNMMERYGAGNFITELRSKRGGKPSLQVLDDQEDGDIPEELEDLFGQAADPTDESQPKIQDDETTEKVLFKLSDAGGQLDFIEIARGKAVNNRKTQLRSDDVFILDVGKHCFVWIGKNASTQEKKNGMTYAHRYLCQTPHPLIPVSCMNEGCEQKEFLDGWK